MASIFTRIVQGEIPSYKVAEDEHYYAFLDIAPLHKGHVLVIPKREESYIFNLKDEEYTGLMLFAKRVAHAIEKAVPCQRIGVAVIGLDVPHTHVHLVPLNGPKDLDFSAPKPTVTPDEMVEVQHAIAACFE